MLLPDVPWLRLSPRQTQQTFQNHPFFDAKLAHPLPLETKKVMLIILYAVQAIGQHHHTRYSRPRGSSLRRTTKSERPVVRVRTKRNGSIDWLNEQLVPHSLEPIRPATSAVITTQAVKKRRNYIYKYTKNQQTKKTTEKKNEKKDEKKKKKKREKYLNSNEAHCMLLYTYNT